MRRLIGVLAIAAVTAALPVPAQAASGPPSDDNFQKVTLNDFPGEPMAIAVLPDLRVLHTARTGEAPTT